jgi:apolipoprotein N-acyltransferase
MVPIEIPTGRSRRSAPLPQAITLPRVMLALLAGTAQAASLAWPFSAPGTALAWTGLRAGQPVWWLGLLALLMLAWLVSGGRSRDQHRGDGPAWRLAAFWGWLFATSWLASTFAWLFVAMHTYAGLPGLLAALAVLALAALLALYYSVACGLFVLLAPVNKALTAIFFAALWLLAELARGVWLTGFGWGAAGYAQVDGPLAAYAAWVGAYGLCALTAWLAMTLLQAIQSGHGLEPLRVLRLGSVLLVLVVPTLAPGNATDASESTGHLSLLLLQGNIPQDEKFETGSGVPLALQWYGEQLQRSQAALVIAPETALPVLPEQLPAGYWRALQQRFAGPDQAALIGMPMGNAQAGYTNSVLGLKSGLSQPWRYDKHHLVPFGEFIPPLFKWFTALMNIPLGDFNRGALKQLAFAWQGQRIATNICYEDLFGEELGRHFDNPAQAPTLFVNVSNLAWFGQGQAMDQHLQIARMRALEFARPFVLATNTGVSAIMDHRGHIVASLPRDTRAVLVGEVEGRSGITPYAWWVARFGLWPLWLLALSVVLLAAGNRWRKRQSGAVGFDWVDTRERP